MNEIVELPTTVQASGTLVSQLAKAEIDQQIATAHAYPRSFSKVLANVTSLVTISKTAAEECGYALPRGGKPILGPSIRLAEIVAGQWGNCRVGARVVHVDRFEKFVEAEGIFHDLETNTATTARVRRRIVDSRGNLYSDDMIIVTGNAACSIAKRNAVLAGVPKAVWAEAYEIALATVKGDVKTLPERRAGMFKAFAAFGVKPDQIYLAMDVEGELDIGLDEIATLTAMHKAIKEGEEKVETYFPEKGGKGKDPASAGAKTTADKMEALAKGSTGAKEKAPEAEGKTTKAKADKSKEAPKTATQPDHDPETGEVAQKGEAAAADAADEAGAGETAKGPDPVDEELVEASYTRGRKAHGRGMTAEGCPPDIRKIEPLAEAWLQGWKDARDEAE